MKRIRGSSKVENGVGGEVALRLETSKEFVKWLSGQIRRDRVDLRVDELQRRLEDVMEEELMVNNADKDVVYLDLLKIFGFFFKLFPTQPVSRYGFGSLSDEQIQRANYRNDLFEKCVDQFELVSKHWLDRSLRPLDKKNNT